MSGRDGAATSNAVLAGIFAPLRFLAGDFQPPSSMRMLQAIGATAAALSFDNLVVRVTPAFSRSRARECHGSARRSRWLPRVSRQKSHIAPS